jgi:hypothetical protein
MNWLKKIGNWLIDKSLGSFIAAIGVRFFWLYFELPNDKKINFFDFVWLKELLVAPIPTWVFLLICSIIIILPILKKRISSKDINVEITPNLNDYPFLKNRKGKFGAANIEWIWDYEWNTRKEKFQIVDLAPLCPNCGNTLRKTELIHRVYYECSYCRLHNRHSSHSLNQLEIDVEDEIIRQIRII